MNYLQFIKESIEPTKRLYCDLDGVLVDFEQGFKKLKENTENLSPTEYQEKYGKNSIWKLINDKGSSFWANLNWMPDGRSLWDYIKRYNPIILSSPSLDNSCIIGKTEWVKTNLNIDQDPISELEDFNEETRFILANDKAKFAKSENDILIDDNRENLVKWSKAGGTGVLHDDSTDTIKVLEEIMKDFN